jgi:hypothetical protein
MAGVVQYWPRMIFPTIYSCIKCPELAQYLANRLDRIVSILP